MTDNSPFPSPSPTDQLASPLSSSPAVSELTPGDVLVTPEPTAPAPAVPVTAGTTLADRVLAAAANRLPDAKVKRASKPGSSATPKSRKDRRSTNIKLASIHKPAPVVPRIMRESMERPPFLTFAELERTLGRVKALRWYTMGVTDDPRSYGARADIVILGRKATSNDAVITHCRWAWSDRDQTLLLDLRDLSDREAAMLACYTTGFGVPAPEALALRSAIITRMVSFARGQITARTPALGPILVVNSSSDAELLGLAQIVPYFVDVGPENPTIATLAIEVKARISALDLTVRSRLAACFDEGDAVTAWFSSFSA